MTKTKTPDIASEGKTKKRSIKNSEIEELKSELEKLKEEKLLLLADFQNYRKRIETERENERELANTTLLNDFLELVDDFSRAVEQDEELSLKDLRNGLAAILAKFNALIATQGLSAIQVEKGTKFDPGVMEALNSVPVESRKLDNKVISVVSKGYIYTNSKKTFRPAKVIIGKYQST